MLVLSYGALLAAGAAQAATFVLVLLHTVVGVVLIYGMRRTVGSAQFSTGYEQPERSTID